MASLAAFQETLSELGMSLPTPKVKRPTSSKDLWEYLQRQAVISENTGQQASDNIIWNLSGGPFNRQQMYSVMESAGVKGNFVLLLGPPAAGKGFLSAGGNPELVQKRWGQYGIDKYLPAPIGTPIEVHEGDQELVAYQRQQAKQDFHDLYVAVDEAVQNQQDAYRAFMQKLASLENNKYYTTTSGSKDRLSKYINFHTFAKAVLGTVPHIREYLKNAQGRSNWGWFNPQQVAQTRQALDAGEMDDEELRNIHGNQSLSPTDQHAGVAGILARRAYGLPEMAMTPDQRLASKGYKRDSLPPHPSQIPVPDTAQNLEREFNEYMKLTQVYYASMRSTGDVAAGGTKAREPYKQGAMHNFYEKVMNILRSLGGQSQGGANTIIIDSPGEDVKKVMQYIEYMQLAKSIGYATSVIFAMPGPDGDHRTMIEASKAGNFIRGLKGDRMVVPESDIIPFFRDYGATKKRLEYSQFVDAVITLNKNISPQSVEEVKLAIVEGLEGRVNGDEFSETNAKELVRRYGKLGNFDHPHNALEYIANAISKNILMIPYTSTLTGGVNGKSAQPMNMRKENVAHKDEFFAEWHYLAGLRG